MLTELESRCLRAIRDHIAQHGHAPTLTELGELVGVSSKGTMHRYVTALVDKGFVTRSGKPGWRGLALTEQAAQQMHSLPLLGRIAAGKPIEAITDHSSINLMELLLGPNRYVLQVNGESMIEAGILDGDLVIVESAETAKDGDIVVALVDDGEATLKRLKHQKQNRLLLIPANSTMQPMEYEKSRVKIQGVLVGQLRTYAKR